MQPALAERVRLDDQRRVSQELACVGCGYLLVGMRTDQRCPECGIDVRRSIAANRVATWPDEWVRKLSRGIGWLIAAVCWAWIFMIWWTLATLGEFDDILPGVWELGLVLGRLNYQWAMLGVVLISLGLGLTGTVLVTFSDAARAVMDPRSSVRWLARLGMFLSLASLLLMIAAFLSSTRWSPAHGPVFWCWVAMFVAGTIGIWNVWTYLARIALRLPDEKLARRCRQMRWIVVLVAVLLFANAATIWPFFMWMGIRTREAALVFSTVIAWWILVGRLAFLALGIASILLLARYLRALDRR